MRERSINEKKRCKRAIEVFKSLLKVQAIEGKMAVQIEILRKQKPYCLIPIFKIKLLIATFPST